MPSNFRYTAAEKAAAWSVDRLTPIITRHTGQTMSRGLFKALVLSLAETSEDNPMPAPKKPRPISLKELQAMPVHPLFQNMTTSKPGAPKNNRNARLAETSASCWLHIRVTEDMMDEWHDAAKAAGLRFSPWVRESLDSAAAREKSSRKAVKKYVRLIKAGAYKLDAAGNYRGPTEE